MSLYTLAAPIYEATQALQRVGEQLDAVEDLIEGADEAPERLTDELTAIREDLGAIEEELEIARDNAGVAGRSRAPLLFRPKISCGRSIESGKCCRLLSTGSM